MCDVCPCLLPSDVWLSAVYNSAAAGFEERQLAASLQQATLRSEQQRRQRRHGGSTAADWAVSTGAELAALAHLALTGQLDAAELAVTCEHPFCSYLIFLSPLARGWLVAGSNAGPQLWPAAAPSTPCWHGALILLSC